MFNNKRITELEKELQQERITRARALFELRSRYNALLDLLGIEEKYVESKESYSVLVKKSKKKK